PELVVAIELAQERVRARLEGHRGVLGEPGDDALDLIALLVALEQLELVLLGADVPDRERHRAGRHGDGRRRERVFLRLDRDDARGHWRGRRGARGAATAARGEAGRREGETGDGRVDTSDVKHGDLRG